MGIENIQFDGACHKPNEIADSTCDSLTDLKGLVNKSEYPEITISENGEKIYNVGGDIGKVGENELECFLNQAPEIKLTPLGLANVLKNNPGDLISGQLVSENFDTYRDGGNCKMMF